MEMSLLIMTAAICLLMVILTGWLLAIMRYLNSALLKRIFPGFKYLKRAHVDYAMMAGLLLALFLIFKKLNLMLGNFEIVALSIGGLYNPSGFILQALRPDIANNNSGALKFLIMAGFIPATLGFGVVAYKIILAVI